MSSDFKIDPESINRYVSEKIIESSIGESLRAAIDEQVKRMASGFDNPMKHVVANAIGEAAREYLESPEIKERLRKVVEAALTDSALEEFISKVVAEGYRR